MGSEMIGLFVPLGFFAMVVAIVIGRPMVKAIAAKADAEAKQPRIPGDVMTRLERMEQSIDAIAVEVERISEGQRFTTKLLSEVRDARALPQKSSAPAGPANT